MNFQKQKKMKFQNDDVFTSSSSSSFSCNKINSEKKKKKKRKISKHWQRVLVMEDSTKRERNGNQAPRKGQRSNLSYKER